MPRNERPSYCRVLHHGKPRGRVWFRGRWHRLPGPFESRESLEAYDGIVRQWERDHEAPHSIGLDVRTLTLQYVEYAEQRYSRDGKATSELHSTRTVLRWLNKLFRTLRARDFHASHVEELQAALAKSGKYNRRTINQHVGRVRRVFRWAVSRWLVPADVVVALECVEPLRSGRKLVPEQQPVPHVSIDVVEATLPELSHHLAGAVRFQPFTGCRPSEALRLRECDVDASTTPWEYRTPSHKTQHLGKGRVFLLGPLARHLVEQYLVGDPRAYLFAAESGKPYRRDTYRQCIGRAYLRATMPAELRDAPDGETGDARRERLAKARE